MENIVNYEQMFSKKKNNGIVNAVIFATYDKNSLISDNVIAYISELKKYNDYIVLVADNAINVKEINKIKNLVDYCCFIRHGEYDFGSYKRGYNFLKKQSFFNNLKNITFCNDSILYQNKSLKKYFIEQKKYPFFGLTCNMYAFRIRPKNRIRTKQPHIQSFFFSLNDGIFKTKWFYRFINSVKKQKIRSEIIIKYEVGLSDLIIKHGYELHSFYPPNKNLVDPCGYYLNINSPFKDECIFIKKNSSRYSFEEINPDDVKYTGQDNMFDKIGLFLRFLFSIGNDYSNNRKHKVITIFGLKISFLIRN